MAGEVDTPSGVAGRYANALFELALEEKALEKVEQDLNRFAEALDAVEDLRRLVKSPVFSAEEQERAIAAVLAEIQIEGLTANFLKLVAKNRRLFAAPDMIKAFRALLAQHRGLTSAEVTSAVPLAEAQLRALQAQRGAACVPNANPPHGFYLREMRTGLDHAIVTMELEERHEIGRRLGLRFLHPFWDADVVDLLFRTPPSLLDRDGRSKGLIRQTLARRFPALGLSGQKKVAATSFHQTLMTAEGARLRAQVGPFRVLPALGVIDARKAAAAVDEAFATGRQLHRAWDLLNLETWARSYVH